MYADGLGRHTAYRMVSMVNYGSDFVGNITSYTSTFLKCRPAGACSLTIMFLRCLTRGYFSSQVLPLLLCCCSSSGFAFSINCLKSYSVSLLDGSPTFGVRWSPTSYPGGILFPLVKSHSSSNSLSPGLPVTCQNTVTLVCRETPAILRKLWRIVGVIKEVNVTEWFQGMIRSLQ